MKPIFLCLLLATCAISSRAQNTNSKPTPTPKPYAASHYTFATERNGGKVDEWNDLEKPKKSKKPAAEAAAQPLRPVAPAVEAPAQSAPPTKPKRAPSPGVTKAFAAGSLRWQAEGESFDRFYSRGILHKSVTIDGVTLWAALIPQCAGAKNLCVDKFIASVGVTNYSNLRFDVMPDDISLEVVGERAKPLVRESAQQIQKSLGRRAFWQSLAVTVAGGLATTTSYASVRTPYGSSTYSITTPDYNARFQAERTSEQLYQAASMGGAALEEREFKAETIRPEQDYAGLVYFKHESRAQEVLLSVNLNGKTVQIPFTIQRKK